MFCWEKYFREKESNLGQKLKGKRPRIANTILKKNKVGRLKSPDFNSYSNQDTVVWGKNRQIEQWKKIESPVIDPYKYVNWTLTKEQRQYNGTKIVSSTNGAWTIGYPQANNECRPRLYTLHKK